MPRSLTALRAQVYPCFCPEGVSHLRRECVWNHRFHSSHHVRLSDHLPLVSLFTTCWIIRSVAVLFTLYLVGGTLYNRYVLELRGVDQIPRFSFFSFSDTVELVRNCVDRVKYRSSDAWGSGNLGAQNWGSGGGSWGGSGRRGYGGLRSTPEEAETMLGGPPGWLDEQDEEDDEEAARQAPEPAHVSQAENNPSQPSGMDQNGVIRL